MQKFLVATFLSAALLVPAVAYAQDRDRDDHRDQDQQHNRLIYDKQHKDYHDWNDREDQAWHRYLESRRRAYIDYARANRREQREYWNWRHEHPDSDRH
jgi:hypothetical protein